MNEIAIRLRILVFSFISMPNERKVLDFRKTERRKDAFLMPKRKKVLENEKKGTKNETFLENYRYCNCICFDFRERCWSWEVGVESRKSKSR